MLFMKPLLDAAYPDEPGMFGDGEGGGYGDARDVMMDGCYMCGGCGADVAHSDTHCLSCGEEIAWDEAEGGS